MKWFTAARMFGPDQSDPRLAYNQHLGAVRRLMSKDLVDLAFNGRLHDARVVDWMTEGNELVVRFSRANDRNDHDLLAVRYLNAVIAVPDGGSLGSLDVLAGDVAVHHDEIDLARGGAFVHRIAFWPTGYFAVKFTDVQITHQLADPLASDDFVARPRNLAVPRALTNAWLEFLAPLSRASYLGDADLVRDLLATGASPNESDDLGFTPLHWAAGQAHAYVCEVLVSGGADPNAQDYGGDTPMASAIGSGDGAIVLTLIRLGADLFGGRDDARTTAIQHAAASRNVDAVRMLLDRGVDVDAALDDGYTPLMTAAEQNDSTSIIEFLLENGADPERLTPIDIYRPHTSEKNAAALARRMGNIDAAETIDAWASRRA